jgi:hypothetical protein
LLCRHLRCLLGLLAHLLDLLLDGLLELGEELSPGPGVGFELERGDLGVDLLEACFDTTEGTSLGHHYGLISRGGSPGSPSGLSEGSLP